MTCTWFEILSRIPFADLRLLLCRLHVNRCPRCRQASESGEASRTILVTAEQLPGDLNLWPRVQESIAGLPSPVADSEVFLLPRRWSWRWAYASCMAVLLLIAGFWIVFHERHSQPPPVPDAYRPTVQTRLYSAKIQDRPARVIRVQSRNPDRTIFWIAKDINRS